MGYLGRPIQHFFFLVGKQKAVLCLQTSLSGGLAGQDCEVGSLKTQATETQVQFGAQGSSNVQQMIRDHST